MGAVLGSSEYVRGLLDVWQREARLRRVPKPLCGCVVQIGRGFQ